MKSILLFTAALGLAFSPAAMAGFLDQDTQAIRVDFTYDDDLGGDTAVGGEIGYGGALVELDDVGIFVGYRDTDNLDMKLAGVYLEEHYVNQTPLIPFLGLAVAYAWLDQDSGIGDQESVVVRLQPGIKVLLSENIALSGQLLLSWADDDIFLERNKADDTNLEGSIGLRFYY